MTADLDIDTSWDTALLLAKECLNPPSGLSRLVRGAWSGTITMKGFLEALESVTIPTASFVRAAQVINSTVNNLEPAITALGFRGAACVAAVHFSCGVVSTLAGPGQTRTLVLQRIGDSIEIGHHFGLSATKIGSDIGILIGFAQTIGPAILAAKNKLSVTDAQLLISGAIPASESITRFKCESYQLSAFALQRLGFGTQFSSAVVMALGNPNWEAASSNPSVKDWSAASEWIAALVDGKGRPRRDSAATHFPELLPPADSKAEMPLHLQMLTSNIETVRVRHSAWNWHTAEVRPG